MSRRSFLETSSLASLLLLQTEVATFFRTTDGGISSLDPALQTQACLFRLFPAVDMGAQIPRVTRIPVF